MDKTYSRRSLITASLAAIGLVAAVPEPVKRYWFGHRFEPEPIVLHPVASHVALSYDNAIAAGGLVQAMQDGWHVVIHGPEHHGMLAWQAAAWRDRPDLPMRQWNGVYLPAQETYVTPLVHEADAYRAGDSARAEVSRILWREMGKSDKPIIL